MKREYNYYCVLFNFRWYNCVRSNRVGIEAIVEEWKKLGIELDEQQVEGIGVNQRGVLRQFDTPHRSLRSTDILVITWATPWTPAHWHSRPHLTGDILVGPTLTCSSARLAGGFILCAGRSIWVANTMGISVLVVTSSSTLETNP